MILMSFAASSTSLTSAASLTSEAAMSSSAWFHQKYLKSNYLASKWPALVQLLGMKPQKKPCFREFREHFYWRLWRPASAFKIYSKGCESNGEALWICQCHFFLSTYWFSDILSTFKKHILRWDTLYTQNSKVVASKKKETEETHRKRDLNDRYIIDKYLPVSIVSFKSW